MLFLLVGQRHGNLNTAPQDANCYHNWDIKFNPGMGCENLLIIVCWGFLVRNTMCIKANLHILVIGICGCNNKWIGITLGMLKVIIEHPS